MKKQQSQETIESSDQVRLGFGARMRNYFLTGLVIAAPIGITIYITWSFIKWVDAQVKPYIPHIYNPDNYLPFSVPGVGLLFSILILTILGALTANFVGRSFVTFGELMVGRMPLVRNLYNALKQIFQTALSQKGKTFTKAAVIEYPRRGLWALAFIATETKGEVVLRLSEKDNSSDGYLSVFLPTTPNPTSGFLLFVPRKDIIILKMGVEDAAKLVISAGLVTPDFIEENAAAEEEEKVAQLFRSEPLDVPVDTSELDDAIDKVEASIKEEISSGASEVANSEQEPKRGLFGFGRKRKAGDHHN